MAQAELTEAEINEVELKTMNDPEWDLTDDIKWKEWVGARRINASKLGLSHKLRDKLKDFEVDNKPEVVERFKQDLIHQLNDFADSWTEKEKKFLQQILDSVHIQNI